VFDLPMMLFYLPSSTIMTLTTLSLRVRRKLSAGRGKTWGRIPYIGEQYATFVLQIEGSGRPVSRILLYPVIHLREDLPSSSARSCAYQPERLAAPGQFGLLAPVVYLAGPSRGTAGGLLPHPFTHHLCWRPGLWPSFPAIGWSALCCT
jgi:hypothetical protein